MNSELLMTQIAMIAEAHEALHGVRETLVQAGYDDGEAHDMTPADHAAASLFAAGVAKVDALRADLLVGVERLVHAATLDPA